MRIGTHFAYWGRTWSVDYIALCKRAKACGLDILEVGAGDLLNMSDAQIEDLRSQRVQLLAGADLPLPGLSVQDGELIYNGARWDCMSGADQLRVGTAIVRKLNPKCGFVLIDKLEQMDTDTLREFGEWLEAEGLQAIATRVSTGDECSIIIEDGYAAGSASEISSVEPAGGYWS